MVIRQIESRPEKHAPCLWHELQSVHAPLVLSLVYDLPTCCELPGLAWTKYITSNVCTAKAIRNYSRCSQEVERPRPVTKLQVAVQVLILQTPSLHSLREGLKTSVPKWEFHSTSAAIQFTLSCRRDQKRSKGAVRPHAAKLKGNAFHVSKKVESKIMSMAIGWPLILCLSVWKQLCKPRFSMSNWPADQRMHPAIHNAAVEVASSHLTCQNKHCLVTCNVYILSCVHACVHVISCAFTCCT